MQSTYSKNRNLNVLTVSVFLAFGLLLGLLGEPLEQLHLRWIQLDGTYSHGYLLVIVCTWMLLQRLPGLLAKAEAKPVYLPLILLPSLIWVFGYATQIGLFQQLALPLFLACFLLPLTGLRKFEALIAPLILFMFAIPLWEVLLPVLREVTALIVSMGVRALGIPAFIDGFQFSLPYGVVLIEGSCAGLNYLLMGVTLSGINASYRSFNLKYTLVSISIMIALAIVGNWIRVFALVLIGFYSNMQNNLVYDHGSFGWWIFFGVFVGYLVIVRNFPEKTGSASEVVDISNRTLLKSSVVVIASLALSLTMPAMFKHKKFESGFENEAPMNGDLVVVPQADLKGLLQTGFSGFDLENYWYGYHNNLRWTVGRLTYSHQTQGKELITSSNKLVSGKATHLGHLKIHNYQFMATHFGDQNQLIVSTFLVGSQSEISPIRAKLKQFTEMFAGRTHAALWFMVTDCKEADCKGTFKQLKDNPDFLVPWVTDTWPYID